MAQKRLIGPAQLAGAAATLYTAPANQTVLLRHVRVSNPGPVGGASVNLTLSIGADAAATRVYDAFPVPAGSVLDWYPYLPLTAGEIIQGFASSAGVLVIEAGGDANVAG